MNIYEKLFAVQQKLKVPKGQYSDFGNYKYRSCEDILNAVKPHLDEVKAIIVLSDDVQLIGDWHYIRATATMIDIENGEVHSVTAMAREAESKPKMDAAQVTGSSSSYARKYALNGLLAIDDTKDADALNDSQEAHKKSQQKPQQKPQQENKQPAERTELRVAASHIATIQKECERTGVLMEKVLQRYNLQNISYMTMSQFKNCMSGFQATPDAEVMQMSLPFS